MANILTWQNVANPNLPNVSNEITEAAKLVTSGLVGLGNVGSNFADRTVNEQLAKYNDAAQIQADVANGVVDLSNASNRLLTSLPNKYEALQGIIDNQQKIDFTNATQTAQITSTNDTNNQSILDNINKNKSLARAEEERIATNKALRQLTAMGGVNTQNGQQLLRSMANDNNVSDADFNAVNSLLKNYIGDPNKVTEADSPAAIISSA